MSVCAHCGQDTPDTAGDCQYCGSPIDTSSAAEASQHEERSAYPADPIYPAYPAAASTSQNAWQYPGPGSPAFMEDLAPRWESQAAITSEPAPTGLLGGHLMLRRATATGSLDDPEEYEFELTQRDIVVGRSPSCEISLAEDPLVSRRHAMLTYNDGRYTITDLGSSNGTYVNDAEVRADTELHDGDHITVGSYSLFVSSAPPRVGAPAIESRATGPLPLLPLDDTDPHLAAGDALAPSAGPTPTAHPVAGSMPVGEQEPGHEYHENGQERSPSTTDPDEAGPSLFLPSTQAPSAAAHPRDLSALQNQLTDMIRDLRQQAEEDAAAAASLRQTLIEVCETLATVLAAQLEPADAVFSFSVDQLAEMAHRTAENPRHLDYVIGLAEHAEELAIVLEAVKNLQAGGGALAPLQSLRSRIEQALA